MALLTSEEFEYFDVGVLALVAMDVNDVCAV